METAHGDRQNKCAEKTGSKETGPAEHQPKKKNRARGKGLHVRQEAQGGKNLFKADKKKGLYWGRAGARILGERLREVQEKTGGRGRVKVFSIKGKRGET